MSTNIIQPSFAAGELSPSLYARVDFAKYKVGAAKMENFYVDYRGGASTRPGSRFIFETLNSLNGNPWLHTRAIPFSFSEDITYVLIFTDYAMQVVKDGALVTLAGVPFTLTTPYASEDLRALEYTQSADVMTITHPSYPAMNLSRFGDANWTIEAITFAAEQPAPTSITATAAVAGGTTDYNYVVTAINSVTAEESLPSSVGSVTNAKIMSADGTESITVGWAAATGAGHYNIYRQVEVPNGTAASGQLFGYIGTSSSTSFKDHNGNPNFSVVPPTHYDPFSQYGYPGVVCYFQQRQWFGGSNAYPVTFYASQTGNFANMDRSLPIRDSDAIVGTISATANSATIQVNGILHFLPMPFGLIVLTENGAYQITGGAPGSAVTPASIQVFPQSFVGTSHVPPLQINRDILHVQQKGTNVRELTYDFYAQTYYGKDVSVLANHLFQGAELVEWAYAEEPRKMVWCVRDDGMGLMFTYLKEQEVYGWARAVTNGQYLSVASVSEAETNAVYTVVRRFLGCGTEHPSVILRQDSTLPTEWGEVGATDGCVLEATQHDLGGESDLLRQDGGLYIRQDLVDPNYGHWVQYVERFDNFDYLGNLEQGIQPDIEKAWCVDCGLSYPQPTPDARLQVGAATGENVIMTAGAGVFTEADEGSVIRGGGGIADITLYLSPTMVLASVRRPFTGLMPNNPCGMVLPLESGDWTMTVPTMEVTGLDHLEGMMAVGIADGNVQPRAIIVNGTYPLQAEATSVIVGLPYICKLQTLRLDVQGVEGGSVQGKRKRISAVTARVMAARGLWMGQNEATMIEYKQRDNENMGEPISLQTGDQRVILPPMFNLEGQMVFMVCDPVPATVLGVIPEIELGDIP